MLLPSLIKRYRADFDTMSTAEAILIPKMTDFDEEHRLFVYDDQQPRKLPSWTYRAAPPLPRAAPSAPPPEPSFPVSVTLDPDVAAALRDARRRRPRRRAGQRGPRDWLARPPRRR